MEKYTTNNGLNITCCFGDVTKAEAEGIVTGQYCDMKRPSMVTTSLCQLAGIEHDVLSNLIAAERGTDHLELGDVYCFHPRSYGITLPFKTICFAGVMRHGAALINYEWKCSMLKLYKVILKEANRLRLKSLAIPLLGAGQAGAPLKLAVDVLIAALCNYKEGTLTNIFIVSCDGKVHSEIIKQWEEKFVKDAAPKKGFVQSVKNAVQTIENKCTWNTNDRKGHKHDKRHANQSQMQQDTNFGSNVDVHRSAYNSRSVGRGRGKRVSLGKERYDQKASTQSDATRRNDQHRGKPFRHQPEAPRMDKQIGDGQEYNSPEVEDRPNSIPLLADILVSRHRAEWRAGTRVHTLLIDESTKHTSDSPEESTKHTSDSPDESTKHTKQISGSQDESTKHTSDSPDESTKQISDSSEESTKYTSDSPDESTKHTSDSPNESIKHTSDSPDESTKQISDSPHASTKHTSDSPDESIQHTKYTSNSPDESTKHTSDSPDESTKHASDSPDESTKHTKHISDSSEDSTKHTSDSPDESTKHTKQISDSPGELTKHTSDSPDESTKHTKQISDSPDGSTKHTSNSPDESTKHTSDSPDESTKHTSDSPDESTKQIYDSPDESTKHTSDSPDELTKHTKQMSDSPDESTKHTSDSPDESTKHTSDSPDESTKHTSDSPDESTEHTSDSPDESTKHTSDLSDESTKHTSDSPDESTNDTEQISDSSEESTKQISDSLEESIKQISDSPEKSTKYTSDSSEESTKQISDSSEESTKQISDSPEKSTKQISDSSEESTKPTSGSNSPTDQSKQQTSDSPGESNERLTSDSMGMATDQHSTVCKTTGPDTCAICMDDITNPKRLSKCGHTFCTDCIDNCFNNFKPVCPTCNMVYGILTGDMPPGTMSDKVIPNISCPGYEGHGVIVIDYYFDDGTQTDQHPNPGKPYHGTRRRGFLPDTDEGRSILRLLKIAFDRMLTFTIGQSTITGREDTVTWGDISHKTNTHGGPDRNAFPDPTFLSRVRNDLADKGVTEQDACLQQTELDLP
ncbi:dentin sialophosphoprotein-like [Gigantopelta aegis]|uniref:dentin sialophosphoprotein-like n=1 Tax=Gigantopelta aegis TaxID=1735272 RepID=UPI001B88C743|nr:dentin sialophosphoprotein-like [Gigantopelta aegis]